MGKLGSNFAGTEFQVFDDGLNPKDGEAEDGHHGDLNTSVRCELGAAMYYPNPNPNPLALDDMLSRNKNRDVVTIFWSMPTDTYYPER
eukprot:scaffold5079_cov159-Ochromonas_danica.AAC.2